MSRCRQATLVAGSLAYSLGGCAVQALEALLVGCTHRAVQANLPDGGLQLCPLGGLDAGGQALRYPENVCQQTALALRGHVCGRGLHASEPVVGRIGRQSQFTPRAARSLQGAVCQPHCLVAPLRPRGLAAVTVGKLVRRKDPFHVIRQ